MNVHCEERRCAGTLDSDNQCGCLCEPCKALTLAAMPVLLPVRIYSGGYWFQGVNAWGQRRHAEVYPSKTDPELLKILTLYPNSWAIADRVNDVAVHCGHPLYCEKNRLANGACGCGCDDCDDIAVALGHRPGPSLHRRQLSR